MTLRCLIIDDKPLSVDLLSDYCSKVQGLELVNAVTDPIIGLTILKEQQVDLVFLDIQMPGLNGMQFIKLAGPEYKIILTTAYADYALQGYEHDVVDYLVKPISFERFYRAVNKAFSRFDNLASGTFRDPDDTDRSIFIKTESKLHQVLLIDILYVESLQNYVVIHTVNGKLMSLQPLKKLLASLPSDKFVRVHRSFVVSLKHISCVERGRIFLGNVIIPIGESYRSGFVQKIKH